jgi:hypothetical protein
VNKPGLGLRRTGLQGRTVSLGYILEHIVGKGGRKTLDTSQQDWTNIDGKF